MATSAIPQPTPDFDSGIIDLTELAAMLWAIATDPVALLIFVAVAVPVGAVIVGACVLMFGPEFFGFPRRQNCDNEQRG